MVKNGLRIIGIEEVEKIDYHSRLAITLYMGHKHSAHHTNNLQILTITLEKSTITP
jgi:hypothetical protein